ncbi:hypothetical protein MINTM001_02140 [Mycobacterium paraintracellulare]|uniref:hypothetical protein n=1 Tax=Mycobacterium paraintracellulare TaxID=1138383 RepID=UPI0019294D33|nr:hypothetical protein [Mycobacterium paraintracellulare]BCO39075.1 hypothetical protein MINTM001_02140 [Mycobacterium paraintracellulare]
METTTSTGPALPHDRGTDNQVGQPSGGRGFDDGVGAIHESQQLRSTLFDGQVKDDAPFVGVR